MMLQLVLVCCVVSWAAADDTLFFVPHSEVSKNKTCPDSTQCPVGSTCCPTPDSSQFACCPYSNGVCCSDGMHCCQKGTECRTDGVGCVYPDSVPDQRPAKVKTLTTLSVLCPDHQAMCPNRQTCCEGRNGEYACCEFEGGVCCGDKIHCCPAGLTCDLKAGGCVKKGIRYLLTTLFNRPLTRTNPVSRPDKAVKCSDGSSCPSGTTCCKMASGSVGCCPFSKDIPLVQASLRKSSVDIAIGGRETSPDVLLGEGLLGDGLLGDVSCNSSFSCQNGYSCCQEPTGRWWCCSYPDAFCCADGIHCCPSGTVRCDIAERKCDQQDGSSLPLVTKIATVGSSSVGKSSIDISHGGRSEGETSADVVLGEGLLGDVSCNSSFSCQNGYSCCQEPSGRWWCCSYPDAFCCADGIHCCPSGTVRCDIAERKCDQKDGSSLPLVTKIAAVGSSSVGKSSIDISHGGRSDGETSADVVLGEGLLGDVSCNSSFSCQNGYSCCQEPSGRWWCCSYPDAFCCADGIHCCPSGTVRCDIAERKCDQQDGSSVPLVTKIAAVGSSSAGKTSIDISLGGRSGETSPDVFLGEGLLGDVSCNSSFSCQNGYSCCQEPSGRWWCCSYPDAFCCADGIHCCPSGTVRCDIAERKCDQQDGSSLPLVTKIATVGSSSVGKSSIDISLGGRSEGETSADVVLGEGLLGDVSCNSSFSCQNGYSCCQEPSGRWWCCSYPDAFCCADGIHCCPSGTVRCDIAERKCDQQDGSSLPLVTKIAAVGSSSVGKSSIDISHGGRSDGETSADVVLGEGLLGDVSCNSSFSCQNGYSCCQEPSGRWWCCSYPDAFCCADGIHCCPSGTVRCDIAERKCDQKDGSSLPLVTKIAAVGSSSVGKTSIDISLGGRSGEETSPDVFLGDGLLGDVSCNSSFSCQNGYSCCQEPSGRWWCCSYPDAFCCADGMHCCPSGTVRCDIAERKCDQQDGSSVPLVTKIAAIIKDPIKCDNTHECPEGNTCCRKSSGQWACCAMPQAVCCTDGTHCCPSGTKCNLSKGTCDRQDGSSVSWFEKTSAISKKVEDVVCPGGASQCPDGNTCCKMASGEWGCCPLPEAVCCPDHTHCCPTGTTCDVSQGKCNRQDGTSLSWFKKTSAINKKVESVVCPGGTSQCPDGNTCCKLASGKWGCCPLPQAVCCSDHTHCCPSGTTCAVSTGKCNRQDGSSVSWFKKTSAINKKAEMVKCDETHQCPDGNTCCKLSTGEWGCCPLPKAVCCPDHTHCCPTGDTCDVSTGRCNTQDGTSVTWFKKTSAISKKVESVVCPGGTSQCPDGNTCCKLSTGQYGCCPIPQAVCCSDHTHCCPTGTTCAVSTGTCTTQNGFSMTWFKKTPAISRKVQSVICPDGTSECPDGNTCCKLSNGQYGCCPLPKAVCCSDGVHCCPSGRTCDVSQGKCNSADGSSVDWVKKTKPVNEDGGLQIMDSYADSIRNRPQKASHVEMLQEETISCPGKEVECPGGSTCCKLLDGSWGCCPYAKASCCSDGVHCCPTGMTCNVKQGTCSKDGLSFTWTDKKPARAKKIHKKDLSSEGTDPVEVDLDLKTVAVGNVKCNAQSSCPDNHTCCQTSGSNFGCCPLPKGVCCPDHIHCCPMNTECSMAHRSCIVKDSEIPWLERVPETLKTASRPYAVMCPDGRSECPDGSTCCTLSSGTYGCCPLPDAECCTDGVHCCPHGTTCDLAQGKCLQADVSLSLLSTSTAVSNVEMVRCPDGKSECQDGNTCCKLPTGQFGCCPLPKAVCCTDGVHCCPSGSTCEVSTGQCKRQEGTSMTWFKKTPAISRKIESVICPDGTSECPDGNTCCKLSTGQYGCCPLPQAVCCTDGVHCCPSGSTCEVSTGQCKRQEGISITWFKKTSAISRKVDSVKCPDGQSQCPDGNTCCKLSSGQWGCCPLPQAVCCSDNTHCCPSGTTCEVSTGRCNKQDGSSVSWFEKTSAVQKQSSNQKQASLEETKTFFCNGTKKQCNEGQTCCPGVNGQYGCCVFSNGVCCSDGTHCCPSGSTCEVESGHCLKKGHILSSSIRTQKVHKDQLQDVQMVKCPDGTSECPDGNTCCKQSTGQYGCCPLQKAVCCSDDVHCCPSGTTCDVSQGKCNQEDGVSVAWFKKTTAISKKVEMVKCDETHECPDGNTCCKLSTGEWGCCPLPKAVCCSDHTHCCPSGDTCDVSTGKCNKQDGTSVTWFKKTSAISKKVESVVCPGGTSQCPDGNTCCKLSTGQYGCCPIPKAVCCSDGVHCCPNGNTCDLSQGTCNKQDGTVETWLKKTIAEPIKQEDKVKDIECDDGSTCPNGSTCCKLSSGTYGCCPLEAAVCCADGVHCCPQGYTCDPTSGTCNKGFLRVPFS